MRRAHTEGAMDLRLLAVRYERLAEYLATGRAAQRDVVPAMPEM